MKVARKFISMCCVLSLCAASSFADTGDAANAPPKAVSRAEKVPETDYGAWIAPGPDEPAILAGVGDGFGKTALHYSSMAIVLGGTALCAAGVAMAFNGISEGLDGAAMHRGAVYFISGSVTASLFSAVMGATVNGRTTADGRPTANKTTSPE